MAVWTAQGSIDTITHIIGINDTEHLTTMHLRDDIKDLSIMDLDITSIDVPFPKNLTKLNISSCRKLKHIPDFPPNLKCLHVSSLPTLTMVPKIPDSVTKLTICNTSLEYLQPLDTLRLTECYLHSNMLKLIPTLPNTVRHFNCFYNPLVTLPILPVPVEKMEYVELYRNGKPCTFDEEQQLFATGTAIIKLSTKKGEEFNEYLTEIRSYTDVEFANYISLLQDTKFYNMVFKIYNLSDSDFEGFKVHIINSTGE